MGCPCGKIFSHQLSLSWKWLTAIALGWYQWQKADRLTLTKPSSEWENESNCLQLKAEKPGQMIWRLDIASEQHFWAHYPLMSPFISSERMTRWVLVHDSAVRTEGVMTEGERAFSVRLFCRHLDISIPILCLFERPLCKLAFMFHSYFVCHLFLGK